MLLMPVLTIIFGVVFPCPVPENPIPPKTSLFAASRIRLPLYFIENRGQMPIHVNYYVLGEDRVLCFTSDGIIFLIDDPDCEVRTTVIRLDFVDHEHTVKLHGQMKQSAQFNFFKGKPSEWITGIPTFEELTYSGLWPGVDLVFHAKPGRIKYEFVLRPGVDPGVIRLAYRGIRDLKVGPDGVLEMVIHGGSFKDDAPFAFQETKDGCRPVPARYIIEKETGDDGIIYGFEVGSYDPEIPLFLDPALLVYCGYIGGTESDSGNSIAVDEAGNAYLTGETFSSELSFPVHAGPDLIFNGCSDAFVAKISADGTSLEYCGYIGGQGNDAGYGIAVDAAGRAYIAGMTESDAASFPVLGGPGLVYSGNGDGFVARLSADGTGLDYCGYLGGAGLDYVLSIDVNSGGCAFVTGRTDSDETTFPVKNGPCLFYGGGTDGFVARLNPFGTVLDYCGYIGGFGYDAGSDIAVDHLDRACLAGATLSDETSFPVITGPDLTSNGSDEAFVARVNAQGTDFDYCGFIGGAQMDYASRNAVDSDGNHYVVGSTDSDESTFPVKVGPDLSFNGGAVLGGDCFVARVNVNGTSLDFCGYIGGNHQDKGYGIAVDFHGAVLVTGWTLSTAGTFPVCGGPDLTHNGERDAFVARLNPQWTALDYCGYIGGPMRDWGLDIAVDRSGSAYVTGWTRSDESGFPIEGGPDPSFNGTQDAFIVKITQGLWCDRHTLSAGSGGTVRFFLHAGEDSMNRSYLLLGSLSGTHPGTPLPGGMTSLPLNWDLFTNVIISMLNTPIFTGFQGKLDGQGKGNAQLNLPPISAIAGITMYFAYALNSPWDFVSNPVGIEIIP